MLVVGLLILKIPSSCGNNNNNDNDEKREEKAVEAPLMDATECLVPSS